ncbi:MAG TPA: FAD-dependent 5-carboxymethylaminomethyl-2-thiouridine(34) oxidoreductase MnmC, partial [Burkholderiales bacterium]|nr:FAD-dependent 5-carboxymethylaminomethyl-2-thiouridine(34) oxidoreductase MnmC [Burkholderiales bacterium]
MLVPAKLSFRDGVPYSQAYDDVYHSAGGGPAQAARVFLAGNALPQRWGGRARFVILETGFGAGVNFLATWRAWREDPGRCRRLHFVSLEKHPLALPDLQAIHAGLELRPEAAELHSRWPPLVAGVHRLELDGGAIVLTLVFADAMAARGLRLAADALFLDGFAPAKNPEMWSPALMRALARLAARGATAATWSVAAPVRHALEHAGFAVEKRAGFGGKREMLVARYANGGTTMSAPPRRVAHVVGAGLAGAAVCERLCARGWQVALHERHAAPAQEASGNHAGAFHPVITPDDSHFARLTRAGFLYALRRWETLEPLRWDRCGLLQLARDAREEASQQRAIAVLGLPPAYAELASREAASAHAGVPLAAGGLWFPQGGWVQPRSLVQAQLDACGDRLERRFCSPVEALPRTGVVILANGLEAPRLHPVPQLRLRRVRGQLTYVPAAAFEAPRVVVMRGGMVLPAVEGVCVVGASYDLHDDDPHVRPQGHEGNLARLEAILGIRPAASTAALQGRVAFRAVAPDRLPVVGRLDGDVYGAFGYGSRGLVWAALAAELIA